jgi:AcrR family transcriptional regulator
MKEKTPSSRPARERLLAAAGELFYEEGVQSVGIDKVIERAGVAKASLYGNFKGKDDLVRAYLQARFDRRRTAIEAKVALHDTPREKLLAIFDVVAEAVARADYRGCPFIRATAEMPADSEGRQVCNEARAWTRHVMSTLSKDAGAAHPDALADQLMLLYDGAAAAKQMDGDTKGGARARAAAALLIDAALGSTRAKPAGRARR